MESPNSNPLISQQKTSDSKLNLQLHPLVILTISDYITRHTIRKQSDPIVGAILGQQHGRDISLEVAFECKVLTQGDDTLVDTEWFHDRLLQYKDVHKSPALDFVGWFTLAPPAGPEPCHLPIHNQFLSIYNESAVLLTFHPTLVANSASSGGKLPLTIYESVFEASTDDGDKPMQEAGAAPPLVLRFKELPYIVETGQAEMISVDFVAKGSANATVTNGTSTTTTVPPSPPSKGKAKAKSKPMEQSTSSYLTPEDQETLAALTIKANATKMLHRRLHLLKSYLEALPPSYLTDPSLPIPPPPTTTTKSTSTTTPTADHTILRSLNALLSRLPLLNQPPTNPTSTSTQPSNQNSTSNPISASTLDASLVQLLAALGSTLHGAASVGAKWGIVSAARDGAGGRARGLGVAGPGAGNVGAGPGGGGSSGGGGGGMGLGIGALRDVRDMFGDGGGEDRDEREREWEGNGLGGGINMNLGLGEDG